MSRTKVTTLQPVRLNGIDEPKGKTLEVDESIAAIWYGLGIAKPVGVQQNQKPKTTVDKGEEDDNETEIENQTSDGASESGGSKGTTSGRRGRGR